VAGLGRIEKGPYVWREDVNAEDRLLTVDVCLSFNIRSGKLSKD
jgi:hypothetical protein